MIKTFQRVLTLLLVLLMICGMFPTALATDTVPEATSADTELPLAEATVEETTEETIIASETESETTEPPDPTEEPIPEEALVEETVPTESSTPVDEPTIPTEEPTIPIEESTIPVEPNDRVPMFSAGLARNSGTSGSVIGGGGGGGNAAGSGSSNMVAAGVTMQVVYYRYDQCYNRYNSHGKVVETVQTGKAIPWNDTGKDVGDTTTTVFDTYSFTPYTFIVKAGYSAWPYVYHFPTWNLYGNSCDFYWTGWQNNWFNYDNPGGWAYTYPLIVRNEANGGWAIEQFLARIILGGGYGYWDKLDVAKGDTVATDTSLFAAVLKYLGTSEQAIQNYLDAYHGKLSITQDGDVLIPTIIWSWVGAEDLSRTSRIYTIGDVASYGTGTANWLGTTYTSAANCNNGYGYCYWMQSSRDTMICKLMLGGGHSSAHSSSIWTSYGSSALFGSGLVNRIQTEVDSTEENGSNTFYYLRGYWAPYGSGDGDISITKTNTAGTANLAGAEFTLYRDRECTVPITASDYSAPDESDAGYVSASVRVTDADGLAKWTGLHAGAYFLQETKAPEGYKINVDSSGNVEVTEVVVGNDETAITLTNTENAKAVSLKKSIDAPQSFLEQIQKDPVFTLAGAEYSISLDGKVVETITTDANGEAISSQKYNVGSVMTIREVKAPQGFNLDTNTYTHTVVSGENLIPVSDTPITAKIQVNKKIVNPNNKHTAAEANAKFNVTDKNGTVVDTITTDKNGVGTSKDLLYGTYTVTQTSGQTGTILCEPWTVTINEHGKVYAYTKENPLWTASFSLHKKEAGTYTPLVATFELCDRMADGTVTVLETGTTDEKGDLTFSYKIAYADGICNTSTYFIREKEAPEGFVLDTAEYPVACESNEQKISVTIENAPILGKLELQKQSSTGKPMQGVVFLLEYSLDGGTAWNAVTKRADDTVITPGSCTSETLNADGTMTTDELGTAVFTGLRVYNADGTPILYRATEVQTQNGNSLMPDSVWEDDLITEKDGNTAYDIVLRVVNSPILELPDTGSNTLARMPIGLVLSAVMCMGAFFMLRRKEG